MSVASHLAVSPADYDTRIRTLIALYSYLLRIPRRSPGSALDGRCILTAEMPVPQMLGPYRVVRPLGKGGMSTVLLAEDTRLGRQVALKTVSGDDADTAYSREQLLREARAVAALSHPNIASVHDVLDADGQIVIVFEYIEGETL